MSNENYNISFGNTAKAMAVAASMPIVAVPIQEVQLLDYAVAHETVASASLSTGTSASLSSSNATYGMTASTDDDIYLGLMDSQSDQRRSVTERIGSVTERIGSATERSRSQDPYTSDQQRERDEYQLDDENWNEVVFEEVHGGSTAKLALHTDWMTEQSRLSRESSDTKSLDSEGTATNGIADGWHVGDIRILNLPEQGISGPFRITSIKHIIPQKKPVDDDEADEYGYKPVTALFTHESNQVFNISFDNGEELGVTYQHPIYSLTKGDWEHAGELEIGEEVLTKNGGARVVSKDIDRVQEVYNLEVKDYHNFLVNESGIVVHNTGLCDRVVKNWLNKNHPKVGTNNIKKPGTKHDITDQKVKDKYGKSKVCYDDLGFPDFSPFVEKFTDPITGELFDAAFEIDMKGNSGSDYTDADKALRQALGDPNMKGFPRTINGIEYTWHHHQDGKTMMLVPRSVNNTKNGGAPHLGGRSLAKNGIKGDNNILPSYKESKGKYLSACK